MGSLLALTLAACDSSGGEETVSQRCEDESAINLGEPGECRYDNDDDDDDDDPDPTDLAPLRVLAGENDGVEQFGTASNANLIQNNQQYAEVLAREFNATTPGNAMKWDAIRPDSSTFDFERGDRIAQFAQENDMTVRGHTLLWHNQLPSWVENGGWTRQELMDILENHIKTVVTHYEEEFPGVITSWDVVNEVVADDGRSLRESVWLRTIGPEYIQMAFEWANEAASDDVDLYYNDFNIANDGNKQDRAFELVSSLVEEGVPIDGVGFQSHLSTEYGAPSARALEANMDRFIALDLDVAVTELDVRIPLGSNGEPSNQQLETQADYYRRFLDTCLRVERCTDFRIWGFTDAESWVPSTFEGTGAALVFTEAYEPKPAYYALAQRLAQ